MNNDSYEYMNTVLSPYVLTGRDRRVTRIVNSDPNSESSFLASFWPKGGARWNACVRDGRARWSRAVKVGFPRHDSPRRRWIAASRRGEQTSSTAIRDSVGFEHLKGSILTVGIPVSEKPDCLLFTISIWKWHRWIPHVLPMKIIPNFM